MRLDCVGVGEDCEVRLCRLHVLRRSKWFIRSKVSSSTSRYALFNDDRIFYLIIFVHISIYYNVYKK